MTTIATLRAEFCHVPLPVVLPDNSRGKLKYFELLAVRITDTAGAEGMGARVQARRDYPRALQST